MKKILLIFINCSLILLTAVFFAFAAEAQKTASPAPKSVAPVKGKAQPAPAGTVVPGPARTALSPAAAKTPVPAPAKQAPAVSPAQQTTVSSAANATATPTVQTPMPAPTVPNKTDTYSYNPAGKPDPFRPFIVIETVKKTKPEEKKTKPSIFPLQRAEARSYKVVGIVGNEDHRVAIAEDASKKFYPLLIGTRIGLHNGKVVDILPDRVIVEENENNKGNKVILKLHKN